MLRLPVVFDSSMELAFYGRDSLALSLYVTSYLGKGDLDLYELSLLLVAASHRTDKAISASARNNSARREGDPKPVRCSLPEATDAAVRMLNSVSGGVQVGGAMNASVHGGMQLETQSHATFFLKTRPFIIAAHSIGAIEGDDELFGPNGYTDSRTIMQSPDGTCYTTTLYDDYTNRVDSRQTSSNDIQEQKASSDVSELSAFEWCRSYNGRTRLKEKKIKGSTSIGARKPAATYSRTHLPIADTFCQVRLRRQRMINYQGIQMPGRDGNTESMARWIFMLHTPYTTYEALKTFYARGLQRDSVRPWEATLCNWYDGLNALCKTPGRDPSDDLPVLRSRGADINWMDAGSGWTRAVLSATNGVPDFFPACNCDSCNSECSVARAWRRASCEHAVVNDAGDGMYTPAVHIMTKATLETHKRSCLVCARNDPRCAYGSRIGWTNRYVKYSRDMFDGSDAATRMKLERERESAERILEQPPRASGEIDGTSAPRCDADLPPGVTVADRDRLEALLLANDRLSVDEVEISSPALRRFSERIDAIRVGRSLESADDKQCQLLSRKLGENRSDQDGGGNGRVSFSDSGARQLRTTIRCLAGPIPKDKHWRSTVSSALSSARTSMFQDVGQGFDDTNVPCTMPPAPLTNSALAQATRVIEAAADGMNTGGGIDSAGPGTYSTVGTFVDAILSYDLNALQVIQFMLPVACYEVELAGYVDVAQHRRDATLAIGTLPYPVAGRHIPEVTTKELRWLTNYVLLKLPDSNGGFQLGLLVTGSGGTGTLNSTFSNLFRFLRCDTDVSSSTTPFPR